MSSCDQWQGRGPSLRERKKQQTRRAIHEAALRLVNEHGLDSTTVERICESAEVSARTFFNYYPSKAAAVLGLPDRAIPAEAAQRFRASAGGLVPALCEVIIAAADHGVDRKRIKKVVAQRPELVPEFTQWVLSVREEFIRLARERTASDEVAMAAVSLVLVSFGLAVHTHHIDDTPLAVALSQAVDKVIEVRAVPLGPLQQVSPESPGSTCPGPRC